MTKEEAIKTLKETYCGNRAFCELFRVDRCRTIDCEIYHAIKALEADQTKHGEWWLQKIPFKGGHGQTATKYKCSNCKRYSHKKSQFCPNCGADMRGGDAE